MKISVSKYPSNHCSCNKSMGNSLIENQNLMKNLTVIGTIDGMPVAVENSTGRVLVQRTEAMGSFFSDIGNVFSDHVGGLFKSDGESKGINFGSGIWDAIGDVFDPNTQVGSVVNTGVNSYVQNLANGGSPSFNPFQNSGINTQFVPVQPQVIQVPNNNVPEQPRSSFFSNPATIVISAGVVVALIALMAKGAKESKSTA